MIIVDDNEQMIWIKEDDKDYEIDFTFTNRRLKLDVKEYPVGNKVKEFDIESHKDGLMVPLHYRGSYYGYYFSNYISSNLSHINELRVSLVDDKISQLHVYLE